VSPDLPLRVNLTALENIALIRQFHLNLTWTQASAEAQQLLDQCGQGDIAMKRDEDLTPTQRFAVKMARAILLARPLLVIDRPAELLPDVPYPDLLLSMLDKLTDKLPDYRILDYDWNKPLYPGSI
jgi:ABC-type sugar transport system ATPase subunit